MSSTPRERALRASRAAAEKRQQRKDEKTIADLRARGILRGGYATHGGTIATAADAGDALDRLAPTVREMAGMLQFLCGFDPNGVVRACGYIEARREQHAEGDA